MFRRRRLLFLLLLALAVVFLWRQRSAGPKIEPGTFVHLRLEGSYVEWPSDFIGRLLADQPTTLIDVVRTLDVAARDERIAGAIVELAPLEVGWGKAEDIRGALAAFKAAGKPVYGILEQEAGGSNLEYFVASVATRLYLAPASTAPLTGLAAQYVFLGGVWEKLGVQMHVEKIAEYKTMGDMLVNKSMSPAHREMADSLLDSLEAHFVGAIADSRGLSPEAVRAVIDTAPASARDYQRAGLADGERYFSEVRKLDAGGASVVAFEDYQRVPLSSAGIATGRSVAVVYGIGGIVQGESRRSALGQVMGASTIAEAIDEAAKNEAAKAIVFRIDSAGGSALASDLIWHATQRARGKKPVIVSMSDVAGSGGYYIAAGANKILAQPTTLTGSIGVVFMRPNVGGLLHRLGIAAETLGRGRYARLNDLTTPLDPGMRTKLLEEVENIYAVFVDRVARGRGLTDERVDELGRGRVWTGAQAREIGLVDETGGFLAAIDAAKTAAGIPASEEVELLHYPRPKPFAERLTEALTARLVTPPRLPAGEEIRAALAVLPFVDGGVLALMPETIRIE